MAAQAKAVRRSSFGRASILVRLSGVTPKAVAAADLLSFRRSRQAVS